MGLDVSHDAWHGAYSAFMRWRTKIAELAGIPLPLMEGFYSPPDGGDWEKQAEGKDYLPIKWEVLRPDPLHALLNHSDCDGEISAEDAGRVADRLEELMPLLPNTEDGGHIGNWKDKTAKFIEGCRAAAERKEQLEFH